MKYLLPQLNISSRSKWDFVCKQTIYRHSASLTDPDFSISTSDSIFCTTMLASCIKALSLLFINNDSLIMYSKWSKIQIFIIWCFFLRMFFEGNISLCGLTSLCLVIMCQLRNPRPPNEYAEIRQFGILNTTIIYWGKQTCKFVEVHPSNYHRGEAPQRRPSICHRECGAEMTQQRKLDLILSGKRRHTEDRGQEREAKADVEGMNE